MQKYVIIDPEDGVFLGTTGRSELPSHLSVPEDASIIALFSSNNIFDLTKAVAFFEKEDAQGYLNTYISRRYPSAFIAPVETYEEESNYVDVVDMVKSGYGEYLEDMIDAIPMPSQATH